MIQFILNDQNISTSVHQGVTLLDFIRKHQKLKGTKIGCREGDCGACTILVGTVNRGTVSYQSITSCISPLGNAHGKHIVTIEGINLPKDLNTVQKAMTDNYATQCGFCTPGFVVSMTGYALKPVHSTQDEYATCNDTISGNICRCTGYKSIEKAGHSITDKLQEKDSNDQLAWLVKEGFVPSYFADIPTRLKSLQSTIANKVISDTKERELNITKVANGTDLYVHNADRLAEESVHLLAIENSLKGISFSGDVCTVGANTTVTELIEKQKLVTVISKT